MRSHGARQRVDIADAVARWRRSLRALPARLRSVDWAALVRAHWLEAGAFVGVLTLAVLVRVVRLGSIPRMITADETDNLQVAYKIIEGTGPGIFGFDWKPAPIFSLYPLAWSVQLFGDTARESMRAPAALARGAHSARPGAVAEAYRRRN